MLRLWNQFVASEKVPWIKKFCKARLIYGHSEISEKNFEIEKRILHTIWWMAKWSVMLAQSLVLLVYSKFHSEISTKYSRLQVFSRLEFIPCKTWLMLNLNLNFVLSLATVKSIILPQSPFRVVHISDLIFRGRALTRVQELRTRLRA